MSTWTRRSGPRLALGVGMGAIALLAVAPMPAPAQWEPGTEGTSRFVPTAPRTSWWFQLRSSAYRFQVPQRDGAEVDRLGYYQHYDGSVKGLASGKVSLRLGGRFADDVYLEDDLTEESRVYNTWVGLHPISQVNARVGRMFLQEGAAGLTMDGLWLSYKTGRRFEARAWGGSRAPYDHAWEVNKLSNTGSWGTRFLYRPSSTAVAGISYSYRESGGLIAQRAWGFEGAVAATPYLRLSARADYDTEIDRWDRIDAQARWWRRAPIWPIVTVQYIDRRPNVDASSYFARFSSYRRTRGLRTTVREEFENRFGAEVEFLANWQDFRSSQRLGIAALFPYGRLGYTGRFGDTSESGGFFGDVFFRYPSWIEYQAAVVFQEYDLVPREDAEETRDLAHAWIRVTGDLRPGMRMILEFQSLSNPYFKEDYRFLVGLDLTMGRGSSSFGLGRGAWIVDRPSSYGQGQRRWQK